MIRQFFCRSEVVCLSQKVASIDYRSLKDFDFLATVLIRSGGSNGKGGSTTDGSGMWIGIGVKVGVIAGATGIGDRGGLWAATVGVTEFSKEDISFSDLLLVCTVDPVTINFEFISGTGEAKDKYIIIRWIRRWIQDYVSIRKEIISYMFCWFSTTYNFLRSIWIRCINCDTFKLIWVLLDYSAYYLRFISFRFVKDFFRVSKFFPRINSRVVTAKCKKLNLWWSRKRPIWMFP